MTAIIRVAIYIGGALLIDPAGVVYLDAEAGKLIMDVDGVSAAAAAAISAALIWWRRDVAKGKAT